MKDYCIDKSKAFKASAPTSPVFEPFDKARKDKKKKKQKDKRDNPATEINATEVGDKKRKKKT